MVRRARGRRGVVRARAALPLLNARSRSRSESHLRYALVSSGLPEPKVNMPIYSHVGEWLAEPDLSYEEARLALEYNGADHAEVKRMRRDITREIDVVRRGGWRVEVFGPAEVFGRPDQTAAYVREIYRERIRVIAPPTRVARFGSSGAL
jgi:very-short-patch-repair endonuclease